MSHCEGMPVVSQVAKVMALTTRKACSWVLMSLRCYKLWWLSIRYLAVAKLDSWLHSACDVINYIGGCWELGVLRQVSAGFCV